MDTELFTDWGRGFRDGANHLITPPRSRDVTYSEGYETGIISFVVAAHREQGVDVPSPLFLLGYAHGYMASSIAEYNFQVSRSSDADYQAGLRAGSSKRLALE